MRGVMLQWWVRAFAAAACVGEPIGSGNRSEVAFGFTLGGPDWFVRWGFFLGVSYCRGPSDAHVELFQRPNILVSIPHTVG